MHLAVGEHLAILAAERYFAKRNRWPGADGETSSDEAILGEAINEISGSKELPEGVTEAIAEV